MMKIERTPMKAKPGLSDLLADLSSFIREYVDGYEVRGDNGDYTPTEQERWLIHDCIMGLIAEQDFIEKWQWLQRANKADD